MGLVIGLLLVALLFGGVGLLVEGLRILLVVALVAAVIGMFAGWRTHAHR